MTTLSTIEAALEALQAGRPVLVLDDEDRENEGDLVLAAETASEDWMAWTIRHSSGYLCAPMPDEVADRLVLSTHTVRHHVKRVYQKLDVRTRREAIVRAHALRLLPPGTFEAEPPGRLIGYP